MKTWTSNKLLCISLLGDRCRAVNPEDDIEYDGIIQEIVHTDDGMIVSILKGGSEGNAFTAWLDSLIPSREASPTGFSHSIDQSTIAQGIMFMTSKSQNTVF